MEAYVNVTGNIAAGCTTLALSLGQQYGWNVVLERDVQSPYLAKFYGDAERWAFHNQVYFLVQSLEQHLALEQDERFEGATVIQDYTIFDPIEVYARAMMELGVLGDGDVGLLRRIFALSADRIRIPDVVVFLHAPLDVLHARIERRARAGEVSVDSRYLGILQNYYDDFISTWELSPILRIDTAVVDLEQDTAELRRVGDAIRDLLIRRWPNDAR